jgi:hypothetical protein
MGVFSFFSRFVISKSWQKNSAKKIAKLVKFTLEEKKKFQKTPNYSAVHNNKFCQKKTLPCKESHFTKGLLSGCCFSATNTKGTH